MINEFKGIVHIGYEREHYFRGRDQILINPGYGRGVLETGSASSFEHKVRQLERLIEAKIALPLGSVTEEGGMKCAPLTKRDLKCRYSHHEFVEDDGGFRHLTVGIGPTVWHECMQDYNRSEKESALLQELGFKQLEDHVRGPGFYFSQGLGAAMLTLTLEGDVVVGIRKSDLYDGAIHGAAGWMTFDSNLTKVHPENDARRELEEELGVRREDIIYLRMLGLVAHSKTLEADFVYVAKTTKEKGYFTTDAWMGAVDAREHRELVVLSNPDEIGRLLENGKIPGSDLKQYEVLAPTYYGLDIMMKYWGRFHGTK